MQSKGLLQQDYSALLWKHYSLLLFRLYCWHVVGIRNKNIHMPLNHTWHLYPPKLCHLVILWCLQTLWYFLSDLSESGALALWANCRNLFYSHQNTVECHFNVINCITISHKTLPWHRQNINQTLNSQKTPHVSPLLVSYRVSIVRMWEKIDRVMTASHCMCCSVH